MSCRIYGEGANIIVDMRDLMHFRTLACGTGEKILSAMRRAAVAAVVRGNLDSVRVTTNRPYGSRYFSPGLA